METMAGTEVNRIGDWIFTTSIDLCASVQDRAASDRRCVLIHHDPAIGCRCCEHRLVWSAAAGAWGR
ncbi:MAG: hypothetical protein AAF899_17285 [Pseudomonadota bacterium]